MIRLYDSMLYKCPVPLEPCSQRCSCKYYTKKEWKSFGKAIASAAKSQKAGIVGVALTDAGGVHAGDVANGIVNGAYESTRFKSKKDESESKVSLSGVEFLFDADSDAIATGVAYARGS